MFPANYILQISNKAVISNSDIAFFWFVSGAYTIFFLYVLLRFFTRRDKIYLIYSAYIFVSAIFCFSHNEIYFTNFFNSAYLSIPVKKIFYLFCLPILTVFYFIFVWFFINKKDEIALGYKILRYNIIYFSVHILVIGFLLLLGFPRLFEAAHIFSNTLGLFIITPIFIIVYKHINALIIFIYIGSLVLFFGTTQFSFCEYLFCITPFNSTKVLSVCCLLEILIFLTGLGYREYITYKEYNDAKENYILKLEKLSKEQTKLKFELQDKLEAQQKKIKQQQEQELINHFEKRLSETKVNALRSQMNPHFIFNSLNTLKLMVLTHNVDKVEVYLTKFTSLLRSILEHSRANKVSLAEEFRTLDLYISLETERFNRHFKFIRNIDENIELNSVHIPPLLFQPFIENAIWHGLRPLAENFPNRYPELQINIKKNNKLLICEIKDNGVGRKFSDHIKKKHKSLAIKMIDERISLLNLQNPKHPIDVNITDLEENNIPLGTSIEFTFSLPS